MKLQGRHYSCGAAAVVNVIRCFGKKVSESKVRAFSSTTEEKGTDEHGIIAALRALGYDGETFDEEDIDEAFSKLVLHSTEGSPVIICTHDNQHWVTVIGHLNTDPRRVIVFDPSDTKKNAAENGVYALSKKDLKKIWKSREGKFFGIVCENTPTK